MPLSPSATRDLLARLAHFPKRALGQNFLVDGNIVMKSLELAGVARGDTVVEIGPGLGTLPTALLDAGADVWAVEFDRNLHAHLEGTLLKKFPATLHLLQGDAIDHPLAALPADQACPLRCAPTTSPPFQTLPDDEAFASLQPAAPRGAVIDTSTPRTRGTGADDETRLQGVLALLQQQSKAGRP